jgi:hypothetical protein
MKFLRNSWHPHLSMKLALFGILLFVSESIFAIDFKEYTDLNVLKLIEMMKTSKEEGPGLDLYNSAKHRTPLKMVEMPRKMNDEDFRKLRQDVSFSSMDQTFLNSYKYILELRVPTQEPSLRPVGILRIYFQEIQYPFLVKEVALDDTIMLFYRLYSISTATQEIDLFGMDFWRARK